MSDAETIAIVIGLVLLFAIAKNRSIAGKLGTMSVTLDAIHTATNERPKGAPTLSREVSDLAKAFYDHRDTLVDRLDRLDGRLDGIDGRLDLLTGRVDVLEHPEPAEPELEQPAPPPTPHLPPRSTP